MSLAGSIFPGNGVFPLVGYSRRQGMFKYRPPVTLPEVSVLQNCGFSSSLKSPARILAVGTVANCVPSSGDCRCHSIPTKKNNLSRFLLKSVPGILTGPPTADPG